MKKDLPVKEKVSNVNPIISVAEELLTSEMIEIKGGISSVVNPGGGGTTCGTGCQNGCSFCCQPGCAVCSSALGII